MNDKPVYKVALIVPYFGCFPNYFNLWLKSASYNTNFDFLIFTDNWNEDFNVPENVKIIIISLDDIKGKVSQILKYKFVLHNPYKLCDYKPLYGLIFEEHLAGYDFWGHCDPDIIWGDLSKFITSEHFNNYDRIYARGHLCLYRNVGRINHAALMEPKQGCITAKDVYTHKYIAHFDEGTLISELIEEAGGIQYNSIDFADIAYNRKQFTCVCNDTLTDDIVYFVFSDGVLKGIKSNHEEKEFAYVHLQKRKMEIQYHMLEDRFLITPNVFLDYDEAVIKEKFDLWKERDLIYERRFVLSRKKAQIKHVLDGALVFRYKRLKGKLLNKSQ